MSKEIETKLPVGRSRLVRPLSRSVRYAFNTVLAHAENAHCHDLHHIPKHRHEVGEVCPAEYHLARQAYLIREFLKTNAKVVAPAVSDSD